LELYTITGFLLRTQEVASLNLDQETDNSKYWYFLVSLSLQANISVYFRGDTAHCGSGLPFSGFKYALFWHKFSDVVTVRQNISIYTKHTNTTDNATQNRAPIWMPAQDLEISSLEAETR
jgi:hypothetical protein